MTAKLSLAAKCGIPPAGGKTARDAEVREVGGYQIESQKAIWASDSSGFSGHWYLCRTLT